MIGSMLAFAGATAQNADLDQRITGQSPEQPTNQHHTNAAKEYQHAPLSACTPATMCTQSSTNTGNVRGYYFVAPKSFVICGLLVPTDASTGPQSIEVVKFSGTLPPAYPSVTNSFTSLFYVASDTSLTTPVPCNITVNAGDTIGVYGARSTSTICSYAQAQCQITILGDTVTLFRSGMQFPLYNQQMHDIWSEINGSISRIVMYVDALPLSVQQQAELSSLNMVPNPSSGLVTVQVQGKAFAEGSIEVYDMIGSKVAHTTGAPSIDLSNQPDGVYFVTVRSGQASVTKRIVLAH